VDKDGCDMSMNIGGTSWTRAGFDGPGRLEFGNRAQDAPIIHFLGPLTFQRFGTQPGSDSSRCTPQPLIRGRLTNLGFSLGTPGLGNGTFAKYPFEEKQMASAEIHFPGGKTFKVGLQPDGG
jgi:hypothetical protein